MKHSFSTTITALLAVVGLSFVLGDCPLGWAQFKEDCIWFSSQVASSWVDAEAHCRAKGAWLLSDDSEEKHDFLRSMATILRNFKIYEFFIGADDYVFEGTFRWIETGMSIGPFTRWGSGQPNGTKGENCVTLAWDNSDLVWYDEPCTYNSHQHVAHGHTRPGSYHYICEKLCVPP